MDLSRELTLGQIILFCLSRIWKNARFGLA
jgi:hypothetical protein